MEGKIFFENWLHLSNSDIREIYEKFRIKKDIYLSFKNIFGFEKFKKYVFFIDGVQLKNYPNDFVHYLCLDYLKKPRLNKFINIFTRYDPYAVPENADPYLRKRKIRYYREEIKRKPYEEYDFTNLIQTNFFSRITKIKEYPMHKKLEDIELIEFPEDKDEEIYIQEKIKDILVWFYNFQEIHPNAAIKERIYFTHPELRSFFYFYENLKKIWIGFWNLKPSEEIPPNLKKYFTSKIPSKEV